MEGTDKSQLQPGRESMGDLPVLSHCSLLRNHRPNPTGVLEHCHEGETNCWFSILGGFYFWPYPQGYGGCQSTEISMVQQFL
jgi:hypothetical protein